MIEKQKLYKIMIAVFAVFLLSAAFAGASAADEESIRESDVSGDNLSPYPSDTSVRQYADGRLIIQCDSSEAGLSAAASVTVLSDYGELVPGMMLIASPNGMTVPEAVEYYRNTPGIIFAEPDYLNQLPPDDPVNLEPADSEPDVSASPSLCLSAMLDVPATNDPLLSSQWGLKTIHASDAWKTETGSSDIVVAVLDTGINYNHEDLIGNMWTDDNGYHGYDFINNDNYPLDDKGHGTHCAGIVGAVGNNGAGISGVAWDVSLMAVKVLDSAGRGSNSAIIQGISYAKNNGADIISMSLGHTIKDISLKTAIESTNLLTVCAAGNKKENADHTPHYPACFTSSNILAVAATDETNQRASYSNYGTVSIDVACPGSNILSTYYRNSNDYEYLSGTSMATPMVAGIAALVLSVDPTLPAEEIKSLLMDTVDTYSSLSKIVATGGIVNASKAVSAAVDKSAPYVEVSTWSDLVYRVSQWKNKDRMRTVVVMQSVFNETAGCNYDGIPVIGNITIIPSADAGEVWIDAEEAGRLFKVDGGCLTIAGNGTTALTLTGGVMDSTEYSGNGGAICVINDARLILSSGVTINGCSAGYGGGVYVSDGIFEMSGGNITGCSADYGGGVYVSDGILEMSGGNITGCSADYGGGAYVSEGAFNVSGDVYITGNTKRDGNYSNVCLGQNNQLNLIGDFTGRIDIFSAGSTEPSAGVLFGKAAGIYYGAENIFADTNCTLNGKIDEISLVWQKFGNLITVTSTTGGSAFSSAKSAAAGTTITLTAAANLGYVFKEWQIVDGGISVENNTFIMPENDVEVNAVFELDEEFEWLSLSSGWNFVSVPKKLDTAYDTAAELFAGVDTGEKAILSYNASAKLWEQVQASTKIMPLNAYWIYSVDDKIITPEFNSGASTPAMKSLKKGWNAVGLSAEEDTPASVTFNGMNWRTYLSWNAAEQKYDSPILKGGSGKYSDDNQVRLWKGGWVYMDADATYIGYA